MSPPVYRDEQRVLVFPERTAAALPAGTVVYQVKVTMRDIEPPIWRRIQIPADYTLRELHDVLVTVFAWLDYHLHQFIVKGIYYGGPEPEFEDDLPMRGDVRTKV